MGVQTRTRAGNGFRMWQRSHMTGVALCVALSERHGVLCAGSHPTVDPVSKNIFLPGFLKALNQEAARDPLSFVLGRDVYYLNGAWKESWDGEEKEGLKGWNYREMPRASPPATRPCKTQFLFVCSRIRWYFWVASMQWKSTIHDNIGNKYLYWIVKAHFSEKKKKRKVMKSTASPNVCYLPIHWICGGFLCWRSPLLYVHSSQISALWFHPLDVYNSV